MEWGRGRGPGKRKAPDKKSSQESQIPRRFEEACAQIQKSLENYTVTHLSSEDDDSESEQESDKILEKVLHAYEGEVRGNSERTQQFLSESLTAGGIVCLICIDAVKKAQPIWSCHSCYGIFHLPCIQKWASDSIQSQKTALEDNSILKARVQWFCPKCRKEYAPDEKPFAYRCFCTKTKDPPYDPWLVPHSCGQVCRKDLLPLCGHSCLLLCHPGPCPPCAQTVRESCYCGKQSPTIRRCSKKGWSCSQVCKRKLTCGQHFCEKLCHQGECLPCLKQSSQRCLCGQATAQRPCISPKWQCDRVCGKPYSCGNHKCLVKCHESGKCGACPESGSRKCPCGKAELNLPCTEKIPPCGDTCDKLLECDIHRCAQRCHIGICGNCLQVRTKICRCGAKEKSIPCSKEFTCETKCKKNRNCKKHACNRKCCEGDCPPCEQICGKTLPCKNHKCHNQCHQGPCYPCPLTIDVSCNCGTSKVKVPCGREKVTKPPKCKKVCSALPVCAHPSREAHTCHFGPCPQCKQICINILNCGHKCPTKCHDNVLVKIESKKKRAGPWEPIPAPKIEIKTFPCPPCQVPLPLACFGNHVKHDFACSEMKPWSCGRGCGRLLVCSNHTCSRECHIVENATNQKEAGSNCKPCEDLCSKPRPKGCTHPCLKPCHIGNCIPCQQMSRKSCYCQLNGVYIVCSKWTSSTDAEKQAMLCCQNRCPKEMMCGHRCPLLCHGGPCPDRQSCKKRVSIRCPCKRIKQEISCNSKPDQAPLKCDAVCLEQLKKDNATKAQKDEAKKKVEELKQKQELDEYVRKYEGKKKRHRKPKDVVEEKSSVNVKFILLGFSVSIVAVAVALYIAM